MPATDTIPLNNTYIYFDVVAHDVTGTIQIKADATGYASISTNVQVGQPKFAVSSSRVPRRPRPRLQITLYAMDQAGTIRYVTEDVAVSLSTTNPLVAKPDSQVVVIPTDAYSNTHAKLAFLSAGSTLLDASDARTAAYHYDPAPSFPVSVSTATVCFALGCSATQPLGVNEYIDTYVTIPNALPSDLLVTLTHSSGATSAPASVTIPTGLNYAYVRVIGQASGADVITPSASGFTSGTYTLNVANGKTLLNSWPSSLKVGDSTAVYITTTDQNGNPLPVASDVPFSLETTLGISMQDAKGVGIPGITVPSGSSSSPVFYVHGVSSGQATVFIAGGTFVANQFTLTVQ